MTRLAATLLLLAALAACRESNAPKGTPAQPRPERLRVADTVRIASPAVQRMVASAMVQTGVTRRYDPAYTQIAYPGGDVPLDRGVCTDVVIRSLRGAGIDLQQQIHEDMQAHFDAYPKTWGLPRPDANIDHRRVPNLMTYFVRRGRSLPITLDAADYRPGDVVAWELGNGLLHVQLSCVSLSFCEAGQTG